MRGRKVTAGVLFASALLCATPVAQAAPMPVPARGGHGGGGGHGDGGHGAGPHKAWSPVIPHRQAHDPGNDLPAPAPAPAPLPSP